MKKKLIPILLCLMVIFSVFALGACDNGGECEHEYGTLKAEVAASCSQDGTVAHYTCAKCGLKFDKDYNQILDLKINKTEHTYSDEFDADVTVVNTTTQDTAGLTDITCKFGNNQSTTIAAGDEAVVTITITLKETATKDDAEYAVPGEFTFAINATYGNE